MSAWSYVLRNGRLADGAGGEPRAGDLAVAGDRIAALGRLPHEPPERAIVLDCRGLVVAPGFIDVHTHSDLTLLAAPAATTHLRQGVTTDIVGNCGWSAFPARGERAARLAEEAAGLALSADWSDLPGFLKRVDERPAAVNRGLLVGHGMVRGSVLGCENRAPAAAELVVMAADVGRAMDLGCLGLSSGLIYPPGIFAGAGELVSLAAVVARSGGVYASHIRSEGRELEAAVEEFIRVGRESGARVQLSHLKVSGQEHWAKIDWLLERLGAERDAGLRLTADRYPYTASETGLDALLPAWAFEGGRAREIERLKDSAERARLALEVAARMREPEAWDRVVIGTVEEPALAALQGRSLAEIAAERGRPPLETFFEILIEDRARTGAMYHRMSEEHFERILRLPWVMIGSDSSSRGAAGPTAGGFPHPRGCGTFPRIIARYVREKRVLSLGEAVRRMTGLPAETFGLKDRGVLRAGAFADLAVFDPERFADRAGYRDPRALPEGLAHVFVNGRLAVLDGAETGERPGRVLRRERSE